MNTAYASFLSTKQQNASGTGFPAGPVCSGMKPFQRRATEWACRKGQAALFLDTGLGKSICQLEWSRQCHEQTGKPSLILTPLAVADQMVREGAKFGIECRHIKDASLIAPGINVINYERVHKLEGLQFGSVSLDESSILKSMTGKLRKHLIERFSDTEYRLACTATPSPNDHMELGNHSEYLGVMPLNDMLTRYFVHDSNDTKTWRLKGHAQDHFWSWVSSWAVCAKYPSDLGDSDDGYILPPLNMHNVIVESNHSAEDTGLLIPDVMVSSADLGRIKRLSIDQRVGKAVELANSFQDEPLIIWCERNDESSMIAKSIIGCVEVTGSMPIDQKEDALNAFSNGNVRVLVTKPSIAGFGMNWQHCSKQVFASVSYSWEKLYQAIRRSWRFGQASPVDIYIISSPEEERVMETLRRKADDNDELQRRMRSANFHRREELISEVRKRYNGTKAIQLPAFM